MKHPWIASLIFFGLLASFKPLKADILLFNLNGNASTVKIVREEAEKRGEKLFIYPNKNSSIKFKSVDEISNTLPFTSSLISPEEELDGVDESQPFSIIDPLYLILRELEKKNADIRTIIFSGHHTDYEYSGKNGVIDVNHFISIQNEFPHFFTRIENLILRGCYSATIDIVSEGSRWREVFHHLKYITGYEDMAESSETVQSQSFVQSSLRNEQLYKNAKSCNTITDIFLSTPLLNKMNIAIWVDGKFQNTKNIYCSKSTLEVSNVATKVDDLINQCNNTIDEMKKNLKIYWNFKKPDSALFADPPKNPHDSILRAAYGYFRKYKYCYDIDSYNPHLPAPEVEEFIALVYFHSIKRNFIKNYPLNILQNDLDELFLEGAIPKILVPDFNKITRKEMLLFIQTMNTISAEATPEQLILRLKNIVIKTKLEKLNKKFMFLDRQLGDFSDIPSTWLGHPSADKIKGGDVWFK